MSYPPPPPSHQQQSQPPYQQQPPLPISPLAYGGWEKPFSRPGILTAVGIFSICLGALSFLVNAGGVFSNGAMLAMSKAPPSLFTMPPMTVTAKTATSPSVSGGLVVTPDEDGLPADKRATIMRVMNRGKTQLTQRQADSLDALLGQAGQKIFPFAAGGTFNPQAISANITERGDIPRADQTAPVGAYYVVGTGRVEVYEDHAVFRPDGSADVVSVSAPPSATTGPTMQTSTVTINTSTGGTSSVTIKGGPPVNPFAAFTAFSKMNPTGIWITLVASFLGALLAIYLFVIGILVLRDSRSGARLHWIYAVLKVPLVIVAAVGSHIMTSSMMSSFAASVPGAPGVGISGAGIPPATTSIMQSMMIVTAAVTAAIYLAYPLSLMFILSTRTVRDYYRALQTGERPSEQPYGGYPM